MKKLLDTIANTLADAALLERGVPVAVPAAHAGRVRETLEENFIEIAFAEAADYDDIHKAIVQDHLAMRDLARPDECRYGDNEACFV